MTTDRTVLATAASSSNRRHAFQFIYFTKAINLPIDLLLLVAIGLVRSPLSVHRRLMFGDDDDGCCD